MTPSRTYKTDMLLGMGTVFGCILALLIIL